MSEEDRFVIISSSSDHYVQCIFHDKDTEIYCEAASGFYMHPRFKKSSRALHALKALGFDIAVKKGNFTLEFVIKDQNTLWAVADRMLETLYRGYGIGTGKIRFSAPYYEPSKGILQKRYR